MPTPSGKLRKGDRLRRKDSGETFEVVERHRSDPRYRGDHRYSVTVCNEETKVLGRLEIVPWSTWQVWELLDPRSYTDSQIHAAARQANLDIEPHRVDRIVQLVLEMKSGRKVSNRG